MLAQHTNHVGMAHQVDMRSSQRQFPSPPWRTTGAPQGFTGAIRACATSRAWPRALELFEELRTMKHRPDAVSGWAPWDAAGCAMEGQPVQQGQQDNSLVKLVY